ncbi:aa3-type cytochrome c oxidase subunit IV [Sphingomonadaceae bacterium jetA1]
MAANDMGNGDMAAHVATYGRMIELLKWGAIAAAILVAIVLWLIA